MQLKFMTLNLWKGGEMWESMLRFLTKEKPDILTTQETYNCQGRQWAPRFQSVDLINRTLDFPYASFAPTRREQHDVGWVENGNAIFSRWPIIEEKKQFFDVPFDANYIEKIGEYTHVPRLIQIGAVERECKIIYIGNVHGIWGTDGNDNPRRLAMAEVIAAEIENKASLILAGDFNMQEGTKSIGKIEKQAKSVFKGKLESTFNMRHKGHPGYASAIVDMVFVTPDVKVMAAAMPEADVSDHRPLVVEVEV